MSRTKPIVDAYGPIIDSRRTPTVSTVLAAEYIYSILKGGLASLAEAGQPQRIRRIDHNRHLALVSARLVAHDEVDRETAGIINGIGCDLTGQAE